MLYQDEYFNEFNTTGNSVFDFGEQKCGDMPMWLYNEVSSIRYLSFFLDIATFYL